MNLSRKMKAKNPNYIGTFDKSEVEKVAEIYAMVRNMQDSVKSKGYSSKTHRVVTSLRGKYIDMFVEQEG